MLPDDLLFTSQDQWLRRDGDTWTLGLTDYGQNELGELVLVELPEVGAQMHAGTPFGVVESVKAVSELESPVAGRVLDVNAQLLENPALPNESPYERGWLLRVQCEDDAPPPGALSAAEYARLRRL